MKVLQVIPTSGPGGAESITASLSAGLIASGIDVTVASSGEAPHLFEKLKQLGVDSVKLGAPLGSRTVSGSVRELAELVRCIRPDVVQSHLFDANLPAALTGMVCRVPVIVTMHSTVYELTTRKRRLINAAIGHLGTRFVAVSDDVASALAHAGAPKRKIRRIYNGVDTARFSTCGQRTLKRELDISDDEQLVGMIANFRPAKDHELLIRAAARVVHSIPNAHFAFAGEGQEPDVQRLRSLSAEVGLADRVHFLGARDDIPNVMNSLDLFVLASKSEGLPVSVVEAMASGLPVVASAVGGVGETVSHGETGFLVAAGDLDALAERIAQVLADRELALRFGVAGREVAVKSFSLETMVRAYLDLYGE